MGKVVLASILLLIFLSLPFPPSHGVCHPTDMKSVKTFDIVEHAVKLRNNQPCFSFNKPKHLYNNDMRIYCHNYRWFPSNAICFLLHQILSKALLKIKAALNNPSDMASWNETTDCCSERGVVGCDSTTNRVNYLFIVNDPGMKGRKIPSVISELKYLTWISITYTDLGPSIPPSFTKLKYLTRMALSDNRLSGPIPEFLGQMQSLTIIQLDGNGFSGTIPATLSSLRNLTNLDLSNNNLTGTIPDSWSTQLQFLSLANNRLSGELPRSLGNLDLLLIIYLENNEFTGDASFLFGSNKSTISIDLANNAFEFNFSDVGFPLTLWGLNISRNKIFGSIPQGLAAILAMGIFDVSNNNLCGEIPQGGVLQRVGSSPYLNNKCLCGNPLPPC